MINLDELGNKHLRASILDRKHVPITISYTISVLTELRDKWETSYPAFGQILNSKIAGLTASLDPDDLKDIRFGQ